MPSILLIDDHRATLRILSRLIRDEGFETVILDNATAALEWLRTATTKPALVLLDIMMPEFDGFETLEKLRVMPEAAGIPVVMLSARSDEECQSRSRDLGASDYWVKGSFDPAGISTLMARYREPSN